MSPSDAQWLTDTALPAGWQTIPLMPDASVPMQRVAARPVNGETGVAACQALSVFQFTGLPSPDLLYDNSDRALHNLAAEGIRSDPLVLSERSDVTGVRSSRYVDVNGAQLWVRYSTYCRGSNHPHEGLVVEEVSAVPATLVTQYGKEIGALSTAIKDAFTARIDVTDRETQEATLANAQRLRDAASSGPFLDTKQREFLTTALAMWDGVASHHRPPPELFGFKGRQAFDVALVAMREALKKEQPRFSAADWTRLLLLAELSFASDVFGAGAEFEMLSAWRDSQALTMLRSIQRALAGVVNSAQLSS